MDVCNFTENIVCFSDKMDKFDSSIKSFLREKMYYSPLVLSKTNKGKKIIKVLFNRIRKNPKKFLKIKELKSYNSERLTSDFIAGMTDRYAINLYNDIK